MVEYQTNIYLCVFWGLTSFNYLMFFFFFAVHIWFLWTFFTKSSFCLLILVLSLHVVQLLSRVRLFATPWTAACWALPGLHHLLEFAQTHVHWVGDAIQPSRPLSSPVIPFLSCLQSFPASGSFPVSRLFALGGQSIRVSASVSVLPMNLQGWYPLGLTGLISLQLH